MKTLPASGPSRRRPGDARGRHQDRRGHRRRSRVIEGTPDAGIPKELAQELARRGVICMCTSTLTSDFYRRTRRTSSGRASHGDRVRDPASVSSSASGLPDKKAQWAGDTLSANADVPGQVREVRSPRRRRRQDRVDPEGEAVHATSFVKELKKYGVTLGASMSSSTTPVENQNEISTSIADFKDEASRRSWASGIRCRRS